VSVEKENLDPTTNKISYSILINKKYIIIIIFIRIELTNQILKYNHQQNG